MQRLLQLFIAEHRARGLHVLPIPKCHNLRSKSYVIGQRFFRRLPPKKPARDGNKSVKLRLHLMIIIHNFSALFNAICFRQQRNRMHNPQRQLFPPRAI